MPVIDCPRCGKPAATEAGRCPHCDYNIAAVAPALAQTANQAAVLSHWLGIINVALFIVMMVRFHRLTKGDADLMPLAMALAGGPWITVMTLLAVAGLIAGILGAQKPAKRGKAWAGIVLNGIFLLLAVL